MLNNQLQSCVVCLFAIINLDLFTFWKKKRKNHKKRNVSLPKLANDALLPLPYPNSCSFAQSWAALQQYRNFLFKEQTRRRTKKEKKNKAQYVHKKMRQQSCRKTSNFLIQDFGRFIETTSSPFKQKNKFFPFLLTVMFSLQPSSYHRLSLDDLILVQDVMQHFLSSLNICQTNSQCAFLLMQYITALFPQTDCCICVSHSLLQLNFFHFKLFSLFLSRLCLVDDDRSVFKKGEKF